MGNIPGGLGHCPNCREMMITENGAPKCFNCAPSKKQSKLLAVDIPNDAEFSRVVNQPVLGRAGLVVTGNTAQDALDIMRKLPMPKNMQEFKQIQKIIKQLEKLVGEDHAD